MKKFKITFFMLAYNCENTVEKAVDSILNQTEKDINLIVRDNGSTDKTNEILKAKAKSDNRLTVVRNEINWYDESGKIYTHDGVIRIWPTHLKDIFGEYISIVDSDDWLAEDFASKLYNQAVAIDADIAVCGNDFVTNDEVVGNRLPPLMLATDKPSFDKAINENYPMLHNSFRTWWGKLFKTNFFLKYYNDAWKTVGGGNGAVLDTAIMLRYLCKAQRLVTVPEPLYKFRQSASSTYTSKRKLIYMRSLEADNIYNVALDCLKHFNAVNTTNYSFINQIHWSYINETLGCLATTHDDFTAQEELSGVAALVNSNIFKSYYSSNIDALFGKIMQSVSLISDRNINDIIKHYSIYSSYLMRLLYLVIQLGAGNSNVIYYSILISCLYDNENTTKIGIHLLDKVVPSELRANYDSLIDYQSAEMCAHVSSPIFWSDANLRKRVVKTFEEDLEKAFDLGDMDKSAELIETILNKDPLNKTALYYFLKMLVASDGNEELSAVIAGSCKSLWPADTKIQQLCWQTLSQTEGE